MPTTRTSFSLTASSTQSVPASWACRLRRESSCKSLRCGEGGGRRGEGGEGGWRREGREEGERGEGGERERGGEALWGMRKGKGEGEIGENNSGKEKQVWTLLLFSTLSFYYVNTVLAFCKSDENLVGMREEGMGRDRIGSASMFCCVGELMM